MKLINVIEILAKDVINEYMGKNSDLCQCEKCKLDILAITLNSLKPKYVVTEKGEVYSRVGMFNQQHRIDILTQVVNAVSKVKNNPMH